MMDVAKWAQYFNEIAVEAYKRTAGVIKPEGSLVPTVQGVPSGICVEWGWRLMSRIPEDVAAGVLLTVTPDPWGLGCGVVLRVSAYKGKDKIYQLLQIYWADFVGLESVKYSAVSFKNDFTDRLAFQLRRACEHLVMIVPRLGEVSANEERIREEMRILNFTLHRA